MLDNALTNKVPIYLGDMSGFITFFDRERLELAISTESRFIKNVTFIRVIERFDIKKVDGDVMVCLDLVNQFGTLS